MPKYRKKGGRGETKAPLHYHVDFLGPLPLTDKKYRYVFIIIDSFTRFCWLYCTLYLSATDAITILEKLYNKFGHPTRIVSHRHYDLESMEFRNYCTRNGIEYIRLKNESLQGYGSERLLIERTLSLLLGVAKKEKENWYKKLRYIQRVINLTADKDVIQNIREHNTHEKNGQAADSNSDDESLNDNTSVYSMRSDANGSVDDESEEAGISSSEKYEEKLVQAIESATEKSAQTRVTALQAMCDIMMHRFLPDFIDDRKITIMDIIEKSIRRGKGNEQALAAQLAPLLIMQLGGDEEIAKSVGQLLLVTAQNKSNTYDARAKCVSALALLNFLGGDDIGDVITLMQQLEGIFSGSYLKGDKTPSAVIADAGALHSAALSAWGLLLTLIPSGDFCSLMANNSMAPSIRNLIGMLQSPHLEVRMVTGEVIALALECGRGHDEDFLEAYLPELIDATKLLATDSKKFRAKRDRKTQRATFRDVLRYLEDDTSPEITIRFGTESLELDTWAIHHQYTALCAVMGPGMTSHLTENEFLREVLQLGSKLIASNGMAVYKQKKLERRLMNAAAFKARTLSRSKNRDKRSAVFA